MTNLSTELFVSFFKPCIRVLFNWERLEREKWPIEVVVVDDYSALSSWYAPWYLGESRAEVNYAAADARPLAISELPATLHCLSVPRQQSILSLAERFKHDQQPVQLVVPLFALGPSRYFLLDGNHRMAALATLQIKFCLMAFVVHGPIQGDVLPDLQHWATPK